MRRNFLSVAAVLALVGGATAQRPLSERLPDAKPAPKVEHRFPSPFKAEPTKPVAFPELYEPEPPPLPWRPGQPLPWQPIQPSGSSVVKPIDLNPFGKLPPVINPDPLPVIPGLGRDTNPFAKFPPAKLDMQWTPSKEFFDEMEKAMRPAPAARVMDATRMPQSRAVVLGWKSDFPRLGDDFEVLGAGTPNPTAMATKAGTDKCIPGTYNCIAHSAGIRNIWVNPYQKGVAWDEFYEPLRYKRAAGTDTGFEKGVQKVAVYATRLPNGKLKEYTHAAVQEDDGTWTSKLGSGPLIRHRTADAVGGGTYGEVVRVYARTR